MIVHNRHFGMNRKTMYCHKCGNILRKVRLSKFYKKGEPGFNEVKELYINGNPWFFLIVYFIKNIELREKIYECEMCKYLIAFDEQKQVRKLQNDTGSDILSSPQIKDKIILKERLLDNNCSREPRLLTIKDKFAPINQFCYKCGNRLVISHESAEYVLDGFLYKKVDDTIDDEREIYTLFYDCYKCNNCNYKIMPLKQEAISKRQKVLNSRIITDMKFEDEEGLHNDKA